MENTIHLQEESFEKAEIFDTPEQLAASMQQDSAPQVEAQPEQPAETPYVDPEPAPAEEPSTLEQITEAQPQAEQPVQEAVQQQEEDYSDEEIEAAVLTFMSERLGKDIESFDYFTQAQQPAIDDRVQAIADFVAETGRKPEDWFTYQSMNTTEMDDVTAMRVQYSQQYPNLSYDEVNTLFESRYKLDSNVHDDATVRASMIQLKVDATDARREIETIRDKFKTPEAVQTPSTQQASRFDDGFYQSMATETDALQGLEFDLGNDKTFMFGINDEYRGQLKGRTNNIENFFDSYVDGQGNWDYDKLNSHLAVIDNIDTIVSSAYRQGLGDGQKTIVSNAANVSTNTTPSSAQNMNEENPLAQQVRSLLRGGKSKTVFNI
jgi:hypothetical protein